MQICVSLKKVITLGLLRQTRLEAVNRKKMDVSKITRILQETSVDPKEAEQMFSEKKCLPSFKSKKPHPLLLRPNLDLSMMREGIPALNDKLREFAPHSLEQAEIQLKYDVYIKKEKELVQRISQLEQLSIPETFDYDRLSALSMEALIKFKKIKPQNPRTGQPYQRCKSHRHTNPDGLYGTLELLVINY